MVFGRERRRARDCTQWEAYAFYVDSAGAAALAGKLLSKLIGAERTEKSQTHEIAESGCPNILIKYIYLKGSLGHGQNRNL